MRIATWNINSVRTREDRVRDFLRRSDVDVLCLQETKCTDAQFPDFSDTGYAQAHHGLHAFNGVAVLSRVGLDDPRHDLGQPGFAKDPFAPQEQEARALGAVCGGVEVWSLYTPNGREIADRHYTYKLDWLDAVRRYAAAGPTPLCLVGDMNIAPTDADVWDPAVFAGRTHVTPRERAALAALRDAGLTEATADLHGTWTYWDYQGGRFRRDEGMRIDLQFTRGLTVERAWVDVGERRGKGASDHAPVIVDYTVDGTTGGHGA
ncbi:exodeoxyribonuclease III [Corynebacterium bovis]|uniref:Exodeoxyribonuclease III n=1 Tax=Corynebacterium bovis TaxID=36808 RepID=A0A3R8QHU5_9CORY|nr:exodeoxyribonuclease III [Corynebacterium bovis]MDN8579152.1 exodeoxyribonuclease III [Corynebacterium bovis]RRO87467.1 exodeoxyribonuclease III [Corynebacterium bovis]